MAIKLFTPEQVSERLHVSPATVRVWLRKGLMQGTYIGGQYLVTAEAFDAYVLAQQFVQPPRKGKPMNVTKRVSGGRFKKQKGASVEQIPQA